jgi:hypothetical protein
VEKKSTARRSAYLLVAAVVAVGVFAARGPILRSAGGLLLTSNAPVDPAGKVDVIVIALDAGAAGILEAADLVSSGVSDRVAVFTDPLSAAEKEFLRRGLPREDAGARTTRQLQALGVSAIEVIARAVDGSQQAADELPSWLHERGYRSAVLVVSADHSRRLQRMVHRSMKGRDADVVVRVARYSSFRPETWWTTRDGLRTGIIELQKLLLDVIQHPL